MAGAAVEGPAGARTGGQVAGPVDSKSRATSVSGAPRQPMGWWMPCPEPAQPEKGFRGCTSGGNVNTPWEGQPVTATATEDFILKEGLGGYFWLPESQGRGSGLCVS